MAQCGNSVGLEKPLLGLHDDVLNLSGALAKIEMFAKHPELRNSASRLAVGEVEYISILCRGMFDLLQEIVSRIWMSVEISPPYDQKKARILKESFNGMTTFEGRVATAEEIANRYNLPPVLANCYVRHSPTFQAIRDFRDRIVHRGSSIQTIFADEDQFWIQDGLRHFGDAIKWREEERRPNNLVPLGPALAHIIHGTLTACDDFVWTLQEFVQFPPPIVPGMHLFLRGYFNEPLLNAVNDAFRRGRAATLFRR